MPCLLPESFPLRLWSPRLLRILGRQELGAVERVADPPAGIDARSQHEAQMIGAGRLVEAREFDLGGGSAKNGCCRARATQASSAVPDCCH